VPSSRPNAIPTIIHLVRQLKPRSILDIGVGFGKWGHLFREYTDILEAENDPARYEKGHWLVRIDGIEAHAPYLTPMHAYLYDNIYIGDATALIKTLSNYDLIFLGDIIEHFEKEAGLHLLREAFTRANKAVIVSTPKYETAQESLCGNELERHRSLWKAKDFRFEGDVHVKTIGGNILLAVLGRPGLPKLDFALPQGAPDAKQSKLFQEIRVVVPPGAKFILVDEEQIRSALRLENAMPFLEKDGQYWGPPKDDGTAIDELERMRGKNAELIVFIWSTFWWLSHYEQFHRHLRTRYACVRADERLIAFDLRQSP
jgi:hypothetical protein